MKIKHTLLTLLAITASLDHAAMSCDCSKITVQEKPDDINAANGLQFSHTAQYRREMHKAVSDARKNIQKIAISALSLT